MFFCAFPSHAEQDTPHTASSSAGFRDVFVQTAANGTNPKGSSPFIGDSYGASLKESLFVVETDNDSARQSLDRVSGQIDRGFASPDQTYESEHHKKSAVFSDDHSESY